MKYNDKYSVLMELDTQIGKAEERAARHKAKYESAEDEVRLLRYLKDNVDLAALGVAPRVPETTDRKKPLTRMRTIGETIKEMKASDPHCSLTESALRRMVAKKEIAFVKVGTKFLINFDALEEYFKKPPEKK